MNVDTYKDSLINCKRFLKIFYSANAGLLLMKSFISYKADFHFFLILKYSSIVFIQFFITVKQAEMSEQISRDQYFINIAHEVASRSKDPSTKVGCVIVDEKHRPISFGYNGFIAGGDERFFTHERPQKYYAVIHAEMNAILFAKRDLQNCKLYCNYACCENCLKFIIQSGIKEVIYEKTFVNSKQQSGSMAQPERWEASTRLIQAAGKLGFSIRNINGTPYLEELRGGKEKIPNFSNE